MKHFTFNFRKIFFNLVTIMGAMLLSFGVWAQPVVVEVPFDCEVVVPGTGGTTGFGGEVGQGGIVVMPDPYNDIVGNADDFTIIPNGVTLQNWSLRGDLSFTDYPGAVGQSITATTAATKIYSYNKNQRLSEGFSPSSMDLARSKGRVYISYDATLCGGRIEFDIYKKYSNNSSNYPNDYVPPIIGPKCWMPDSVYTYSVDQIASDNLTDAIGVDKYYWTVTNGTTSITNFYTSADESSITFTAPTDISGNWYIECCYGRANDWDGDGEFTTPANHTTCVQLPIGSEPLEPLVEINGIENNCVSANDDSFTAAIDLNNVNYDPSYNYAWSSDNPVWTFSPQTGTSTTISDVDGGIGNVILSVTNLVCGTSKDFEYQVNRSFDAPDVSIVSSTSSCVEKGTNVTFSVSGPTGVQTNNTEWTFSPDESWTVVNSNGTNSVITVAIPPSASGTYSVSASPTATECASSSVNLDIYIKPDDPVFSTANNDSPKCVDYDGSSSVNYTVSPVSGATGYHWTFPASWNPSSTTTPQPTVNVTPATDGNASGTVTVKALGSGSCDSNPVNYTIHYNPIQPDDIDNVPCWNFGYDADNVITVQNAPGNPFPFFGTYNVTSSPSGLFSSTDTDPLTGEITLHTLGSAPSGTYTLTITHVSGGNCIESGTNVIINYGGNNPSAITFNNNGSCDFYFGPTNTSAWYVDGVEVTNGVGGVTIIGGTTLILCGTGTPPTSVCASVEEDGCNTMVCSATVGSASAMNKPDGNTTSVNDRDFNNLINVFPNPNDGNFTIEIPKFENSAKLDMYDINGKFVRTFQLSEGRNLIKEDVSRGSYILLFSIDNNKVARKIEILK